MAFNQNTQRRSNDNSANGDQQPSWKAQGFINLYLPSKDGKRRKLAGIPLKDDKVNEKTLRAWLEESPDNIDTLLSKLIIEYQPAAQAEGTGFDLS